MLHSLVDFLGPHPPAPLDVPEELVEEEKEARRCALIRNLLVFIIIFVLVLLLGKWLWNSCLTPHVTVVRPLQSIWPLLGIIVLFSILRGGR